MPKQLQPVTLVAPAFKGLNTQDSPIDLEHSYALQADNCVVDLNGRLSARKGARRLFGSDTPSGYRVIRGFITKEGESKFLVCGGTSSKGFTIHDWNPATQELTNSQPLTGTPMITLCDQQIVQFDNQLWFFQRGRKPWKVSYEPVGKTFSAAELTAPLFNAVGDTGEKPNAVLAAFGRLWCADSTNQPGLGIPSGNRNTVWWSSALNGDQWFDASMTTQPANPKTPNQTGPNDSGLIDLTYAWPRGTDNVVALAEHNGFLVIFGETSILIYSGAEDPANLVLVDAIDGIGCYARDSIQSIGTDIVFLSREGVRSLGRTIQEKSVAIGDLSRNIKDQIQTWTSGTRTGTGIQQTGIKSAYLPNENLYLLTNKEGGQAIGETFAFDVRTVLDNGAYRVTRWQTDTNGYYVDALGNCYFATDTGVCLYDGYLDEGRSYELRYRSPQISLGDTAQLKFLKSIEATFLGGNSNDLEIKWWYGYGDFPTGSKRFSSEQAGGIFLYSGHVTPPGTGVTGYSQYGSPSAPYTLYSSHENAVSTFRANTTGSGTVINIALTARIESFDIAIQQFNLQTLTGRLV